MGVKTRNLGNSEGKDIQWQAPLNADGSTIFNVEAGKGYFINTTGGEVELKLPTGSIGDRIAIMDFGGTFNTNPIRLNLNGQKLNGSTNPSGTAGQENYVKIETQNARLELVFSDSDKGWVVFENEAKSSPTTAPFATFVAATGGTVTTSGNFKIHTFTGDGCFVVSDAGNAAGSNSVDYLVVAGGGGGGGTPTNAGGGGGAGGFRYSSTTYTSPSCAPGHPLRASCSIPVTATAFPITVGGGGAGGPGPAAPNPSGIGSDGSNSVFSTITSTGGGGGGHGSPGSDPNRIGRTGGSGGGGGGGNPGTPLAAGNTPPVSPPQGNPGGNSGAGPNSPDHAGSGGGGATAAGGSCNPGNAAGSAGGDGAGLPTAFGTNGVPCGGFRYYAGGGGGGFEASISMPQPGQGGKGGGGNSGQAGTANSGGGGGGGCGPNSTGGAGGKGIVVIRYKFQS